MKKFLISVGVMLVGMAVLQAEQLSFVTVMSAPVGSFAQVETQGTASVVNLDLHKSAVTLKGTQPAKLGKVTLSSSTLGGDVTQFKTNTLNLAKDGTIKGGSLIAGTLTINRDTNAIILGTLSSDATITTMAAKTGSLNIHNGDSKITGTSDIEAVFNWETNTNTPGDGYNANRTAKLLKGHKNEPIKCLVVKKDCEEIGSHEDATKPCSIVKHRKCKGSDPDPNLLIGNNKCIAKLTYGTGDENYSCDNTVIQEIPEGCSPGGECNTCDVNITYIDTSTFATGCGLERKDSIIYANWWIHKATYKCEWQLNRNGECISDPTPSDISCGDWYRTTCKHWHPNEEWDHI